jgi:hypothetical protein
LNTLKKEEVAKQLLSMQRPAVAKDEDFCPNGHVLLEERGDASGYGLPASGGGDLQQRCPGIESYLLLALYVAEQG